MFSRKTTIAILLVVCMLVGAQAKPQRRTWAGCYSDLAPAGSDSGDIVGAGTIRLVKKNNVYTGTFQQLRDDSGEGFPTIPLQDLIISETRKTISFVVQVHTYESDKKGNEILRASKVTGRFTKQGIKLTWQEFALQYARPNPLLKRKRTCA